MRKHDSGGNVLCSGEGGDDGASCPSEIASGVSSTAVENGEQPEPAIGWDSWTTTAKGHVNSAKKELERHGTSLTQRNLRHIEAQKQGNVSSSSSSETGVPATGSNTLTNSCSSSVVDAPSWLFCEIISNFVCWFSRAHGEKCFWREIHLTKM